MELNLKSFSIVLLFCVAFIKVYSQPTQSQNAQPVYPRIAGYVGVVHPLVNFTDGDIHTNFNGSYTVGIPTGINIWKSGKVGFSVELVPFIHAENGTSKMSNLLFHPGVLLPLGKGFTFIGRAAFETSGRYGITPILNKVIRKNKHSNFFVALPLPIRFGNNRPGSAGVAFQFGLGF